MLPGEVQQFNGMIFYHQAILHNASRYQQVITFCKTHKARDRPWISPPGIPRIGKFIDNRDPLIPEQEGRIFAVRIQAVNREGFQRESDADREIVRAHAVVAPAEGEGGGPAAQIPVEGIILFLELAVAGLVVLGSAGRPVFVEPVIDAVDDQVVAQGIIRSQGRIILQETMADRPAPGMVGLQGQEMVRLFQVRMGQVEPGFRGQDQPFAGLEIEVGVKIRKSGLARLPLEAPVGV